MLNLIKVFLNRISLRGKFLFAPFIAMIAMFMLSALFMLELNQLQEGQHEMESNDLVIINELTTVSVDISQFHSRIYDILLMAKDGADEEKVYEFGKPALEGLVELETMLITARDTSKRGGMGLLLNQLESFDHIVDDFVLYKNTAITAIEMATVDASGAKEQLFKADDIYNHLILEIHEAIKLVGNVIREDLSKQREKMEETLKFFVIISFIAIGGTFIVSLYLSGALGGELGDLIQTMIVLSQGNTSVEIKNVSTGKEMTALANGLRAFQQSLKKNSHQTIELERANILLLNENEQRKKTAADLEETRAHFQYTLDHNPTIIYTCNSAGAVLDVIFVSENSQKVIGYEASDLLGDKQKWLAKLQIDEGQFLNTQMSELYKKGCLVRDYRIRNASGDYIWVQDSLTLSYRNSGPVEVLGSLTNITEIKAAEENLVKLNSELFDLASSLEIKVKERTVELEEANQDLKQLSEAKSEFVSIVSHDLRTPLTSIKLFSDIMLDDIENIDKASQEEYLSIISAETDRLSRLISNVLDYQKISAGKMQWNDDYVDIVEVVSECVKPFKISVESKGLEFICECDEDEIKTVIDGDRLAQVVYNLLSNSLKFTEDGFIKVGLKSLKTVDGECFRLFVSDSGPGMAEDQLDNIFQPFEQIQGSANMGKGTGLGLYITSCVVDRYHGRAWAESVLGEGAIFNIEMPVRHQNSYVI